MSTATTLEQIATEDRLRWFERNQAKRNRANKKGH